MLNNLKQVKEALKFELDSLYNQAERLDAQRELVARLYNSIELPKEEEK